ncbi:hypothetical protein QCA50_020220 [Cerrena zonata]|uniref:WD40 repeat-like protein n=1 Tax=Cerrena zonata TaxID=2478898 RepID=A0AAW0FC64_9APHY
MSQQHDRVLNHVPSNSASHVATMPSQTPFENASKTITNSDPSKSPWGIFLDKLQQFGRKDVIESIDECFYHTGGLDFEHFRTSIKDTNWKLHHVTVKARQLRGTLAVGMLTSVCDIRNNLAELLFLCEQNAAVLFPQRIFPPETFRDQYCQDRSLQRTGMKRVLHGLSSFGKDKPTFGQLPVSMEELAQCFTTFLDCLNEYPDPETEELGYAVFTLASDLEYWSSCLKEYQGQLTELAVRQYIHDITLEIDVQLRIVADQLPKFITSGFKTIISHQKDVADNLVILATFFTSTAATTLQFSYAQSESPLFTSVNAFWFLALVFSLGAAGNGLMSLSWKRPMNNHPVASWILIWVTRSPLLLVILAFGCFSVGIVLLAYSSGQNKIVSTLVAVLSGISCFFLFVLYISIIGDKHTTQWLRRIIPDIMNSIGNRCHLYTDRIKSFCLRDKIILPYHNDRHDQSASSLTSRGATSTPPAPTTQNSLKPGSKGRTLKYAIRYIMHRSPFVNKLTAMKRHEEEIRISAAAVSSMQFSQHGNLLAISSMGGELVVKDVGNNNLKSGLKRCYLDGLVSQVLWSPDGKYLLTKSKHRIALHTKENVEVWTLECKEPIASIAWLPSGTGFLCAKARVIEKYPFKDPISTVPECEYRYNIHKIDLLDIAVVNPYRLGDTIERVVCIGTLAASDGGLNPSSKARTEKRVLVYNLDKEQTESFMPILHDVNTIVISKTSEIQSDISILISYNKAPPQRWRIKPESTRIDLRHTYMSNTKVNFAGPAIFGGSQDQFVLCGTDTGDIYIWHRISGVILRHIKPNPQDSVGPARTNDESSTECKDHPTYIAWNKGSNAFMFATAKHDTRGQVELWSETETETETVGVTATSG